MCTGRRSQTTTDTNGLQRTLTTVPCKATPCLRLACSARRVDARSNKPLPNMRRAYRAHGKAASKKITSRVDSFLAQMASPSVDSLRWRPHRPELLSRSRSRALNLLKNATDGQQSEAAGTVHCREEMRRVTGDAGCYRLERPAYLASSSSLSHERKELVIPASADLAVNMRSGMTSSALALAAVLVDNRPGTRASNGSPSAEVLERASRDDYDRWLTTALGAGGCVRPIRLRGTVREVDTATGEVLGGLDTDELPDKTIYVPCGDRRGSICPPVRRLPGRYLPVDPGWAGGRERNARITGQASVRVRHLHRAFVRAVHTRVVTSGGAVARCRPRRKLGLCQHGRRISCGQRHNAADSCLGQPICPDCYDYSAAVVWNAHASELWRRTTIAIRRRLDKLAKAHGTQVKVSYAKVAEFQRRELVHFHAVFRLDGHDPVHSERIVPPHLALTGEVLAEVIRQAASSTWFATVSHPARSRGWTSSGSPDRPARRAVNRQRRGYRHKSRGLPGQIRDQVHGAGRCPARPYHRSKCVHLCRSRHARGSADRRVPASRCSRARRLPGAAQVGAHARLPRPLRDQVPAVLHHHAGLAGGSAGLDTPTAAHRHARQRQHRRHHH